MGKVVITSAGYLGDVAPFVPVGRRLVDAGHRVTFVAPVGFGSVLATEPFVHPAVLGSCWDPVDEAVAVLFEVALVFGQSSSEGAANVAPQQRCSELRGAV